MQVIQGLLEILGIEKDRLNYAWVHPSEISRLLETVNGFNEGITKLGPSAFPQSEGQEEFKWWNQLKKCSDCHQCREVCPICFCKKCYPESFQNFGIGWLVHVMERCTNCGACQDICPQQIDLLKIVQSLQQKISNLNTIPLNFPISQAGEKAGVVNITK